LTRAGQDLSILIVDDNPDHIRIISWALEQNKNRVRTVLVRDGQTALDHLTSKCVVDESGNPVARPDMIFLDLNLPKVDGREVLKFIKSTPAYRRIPVIVFSSSEREEDISTAYELGANTYISKSTVFDEFSQAMDVINRYWGQIALLPRINPEGTDAVTNLHSVDRG
jgi:two-component system response regulator